MLFAGYAKGSLGELRTQIMIGNDLNYFEESQSEAWISESRELSKMLHGLIRSLQNLNLTQLLPRSSSCN